MKNMPIIMKWLGHEGLKINRNTNWQWKRKVQNKPSDIKGIKWEVQT